MVEHGTARSSAAEASESLSPALRPRAVRLLDELRARARNDVVCVRTGVLAAKLGVSVDTVRRGLADLQEAGRIEDTGLRQGKARAFRLLAVESPQLRVESPQRAAHANAAAAPLGGRAAADLPAAPEPAFDWRARQAGRGVSPMTAEDRAWLDGFERTPELDGCVARAQQWFAQLNGDADLGQLEAAATGECGDCGRDGVRLRLGRFELCRGCASSRVKAGMRLASAVAAAETT